MNRFEIKQPHNLLLKIKGIEDDIEQLTKILNFNSGETNRNVAFSIGTISNDGIGFSFCSEIPIEVRKNMLHVLIAHYQNELDNTKRELEYRLNSQLNNGN